MVASGIVRVGFLHVARRHRRRFEPEKGPERQRRRGGERPDGALVALVDRREVAGIEPEEADERDRHERQQLQDRRDHLHDARLLDAAHVDEGEHPDGEQRHGERVGLALADDRHEMADIAGERHGHPGIAGPERYPVAPGDEEARELAEALGA